MQNPICEAFKNNRRRSKLFFTRNLSNTPDELQVLNCGSNKFYRLIPFGGNVVGHELRGTGTLFDARLSLSAIAVEFKGNYYILLTNRLPETKREIQLDLAGKQIKQIYLLTADSVSEENTAMDKPIRIRSGKIVSDDRITLPPGSITLLQVK